MANRRIETLSKGYKQRAGLAQAIIHDPPILILDEPTTGLDPNQIIEIRALIKNLGQSKTVLLSTHILQEVEAVCTQVLILNAGRVAAQGSPAEIASSLRGGASWTLTLKGTLPPDTVQRKLDGLAASFDGGMDITNVSEADGLIHAAFIIHGDADGAEQIFDWAVSLDLKILEMSKKKTSLEDIFVKLTGTTRNKTEAADEK
jgi:ABC-2 type transport system ATP-binding protein